MFVWVKEVWNLGALGATIYLVSEELSRLRVEVSQTFKLAHELGHKVFSQQYLIVAILLTLCAA